MARDNPTRFWAIDQAIITCHAIEEIAPRYGAHVALTGGTLYKSGARKDLDVLFYRIRQVRSIDRLELEKAIVAELGWTVMSRHGWVTKFEVDGAHIDAFFPEHVDRGSTQGEDYNGQVTDDSLGTGADELPF